jgi:hypothetical protein
MKYVIFFIIAFNTTIIAQTRFENDSILIWNSNRKLEWSDFKSENKIHEYEFAQAVLTPSINVYPNTFSDLELKKLIIVAQMNKNESWFKSKSDHILIHEQGHFDITEIFARKIRKELYKRINTAIGFSANDFLAIFNKLENEHWIFQDKYEFETQRGTHYNNQTSWNKRILAILNELEQFELDININEVHLK